MLRAYYHHLNRMSLIMRGYIFLVTIILGCLAEQKEFFGQPEQVHLSLGEKEDEMVVTWVTMNMTLSIVEYGLLKETMLRMKASGSVDIFVDGGSEKRKLFIHRVSLLFLKPRLMYVYHVGGKDGWSPLYMFRMLPYGTGWSPHIALFGDMGNVNALSMSRLQTETQQGKFDAIIHVGDFAYNMDTNNGRVGDDFMNQIQSIAAYVPYMTAVGNHEANYNFSNYRERFTMPGGDTEGMFYSFNLGPAHFVVFSSEFYYFPQFGWTQIATQYKWLMADLAKANLPESRKKRPWIISLCHRPLYCSNSNDPEHCTNKDNVIREGLPLLHAYSIEKLLNTYHVDLHFQAHEHSYERMWPVYKSKVCNGTGENPYYNPRATVHIVTGSAGCQEGVDPFFKKPFPYSAFHSDDYGFTRMSFNRTHINLQQTSDEKNGQVIDRMTIIKDKEIPFNCDSS